MADSQLIYITLDLRRALWISQTTGAKILCAYSSDLLKPMREQGADIWCFEEEYPEADIPRSTFMLLSRALTLNMLRELGKPLKFLVFKASNKLKNWAENEGWELLSAPIETCRTLEDKVSFAELAEKHSLKVPKHQVLLWDEAELSSYQAEFGEKFVVQGRMGHAGNCTYIVEKNKSPELTPGSRVKLSEWIEGKTYTVNASYSSGALRYGPVWQQIMHVPEWNSYEMGTVGVSPAELNEEATKGLSKTMNSLIPVLDEVKYSGFFGIDLILDESGNWWIIEINPRLTASISLQCFIDFTQNRKPILTPPNSIQSNSEELQATSYKLSANYGQILLRNSLERAWAAPKTLTSGIYRQEEGAWKRISRVPDARLLEKGDILLLLARKAGTKIDPSSDYASLQFLGSAYENSDKLSDHFIDFYERVVKGYLIRPKDFWTDKYTRVTKPSWLIQKPVAQGSKYKTQCEVLPEEVIKVLGKAKEHWLVEKADGTRGWLSELSALDQWQSSEAFEMPHRQSKNPQEFFDHWKGTSYKWGGKSEEGIDCSAFVQRYFWEVKGIALPKHSQDQKAACSEEVPMDDLKDDDLVFCHSKEKGIAHVGVVFEGEIWHSSLETGVIAQKLEELRKKYELEAGKRVS